MLTKKQEEWLSHLSNTKQVKIVPYNPKVKKVFAQQKRELGTILGEGYEILHKGATSLGISGKGDIDIYIPVNPEQFNQTLEKLKSALGEPGSFYPLERVRWNRQIDQIEVEIFLINNQHESWKQIIAFEDYLKTHPEALEKYKKLKEEANGLSNREYYRRKIEFMNSIYPKKE